MINQGILRFKNVSVITMAHWKPHLEVRYLEIVWMDINPSLIMMNRVLKMVTLSSSNTK